MGKVKGGAADRHNNQPQFRLTLFDNYLRLKKTKIESGDQKPLLKRGETEKPNE